MDRKAEVTDADTTTVDSPALPPPKVGDVFLCPRCSCRITVSNPSPLWPHQLRPFVCACGMRMQKLDETRQLRSSS
jgi:hypothetical protein